MVAVGQPTEAATAGAEERAPEADEAASAEAASAASAEAASAEAASAEAASAEAGTDKPVLQRGTPAHHVPFESNVPIIDFDAYGQPIFGRPGQARPEYLPYRSGLEVPKGYELEESIAWGPAIAGALSFAVPYGIGVGVVAHEGMGERRGWLLVPVFGPWIMVAQEPACTGYDTHSCQKDNISGALIFDGILQASGVALLVYGITTQTRRFVLQEEASLELVPSVGPGYAYLGVVGRL
jgi:hypothetical protein